MDRCEKKILVKEGGKFEPNWEEVWPSDLAKGDQPVIRCVFCHGKVQLHKRRVEHGPKDHVEHASHEDTKICRYGSNYEGTPGMSRDPVE
jgi:hypothetical protein